MMMMMIDDTCIYMIFVTFGDGDKKMMIMRMIWNPVLEYADLMVTRAVSLEQKF